MSCPAPAPAKHVTPAPVVVYIAPAPAVFAARARVVYIALVPALSAASAPAVSFIVPAIAVYAALMPAFEKTSHAPVVSFAASAPDQYAVSSCSGADDDCVRRQLHLATKTVIGVEKNKDSIPDVLLQSQAGCAAAVQ